MQEVPADAILGPKAIEALAAKMNNPGLSKIHGGVDMIFEDGEWLWQKSGDLLWRRNLHIMQFACSGAPFMAFPETTNVSKPHSYAFVSPSDAMVLRNEIYEHIAKTTSATLPAAATTGTPE